VLHHRCSLHMASSKQRFSMMTDALCRAENLDAGEAANRSLRRHPERHLQVSCGRKLAPDVWPSLLGWKTHHPAELFESLHPAAQLISAEAEAVTAKTMRRSRRSSPRQTTPASAASGTQAIRARVGLGGPVGHAPRSPLWIGRGGCLISSRSPSQLQE